MPLGLLGGAATSASSVRVQESVAETGVVGGRRGRTASMARRACSSAWLRQCGAGGVTKACQQRPGWPKSMGVAGLACWIAEVARIGPASTCASMADWRAKKRVGTAIRVLRRCPTGERGSLLQHGAATSRPAAAFLLYYRALLWRRGRRKLPGATRQIGELRPVK